MKNKKQDQEETMINKDPKQQEEQKPQLFGSNPITMKCPFCLNQIKTQIILKPQSSSMLLGFFLFSLYPNIIMLLLIIVALQVTSTKKHRCCICQRQLGSDGKFLIILKDQLYSFSLGGSGLLISKKILVSCVIFGLLIGSIALRVIYYEQNFNWTEISWNQFKQQCHQKDQKCNLQNKTVKNWKGYVMRVDDHRQNFRRFYHHAVSLYIKMDPTEHNQRLPDLLITADSQVVYDINSVLDQIKHGDEVIFNATFKFMTHQNVVQNNRHFHINQLNKTGFHNPNILIYATDEQNKWIDAHYIPKSTNLGKNDDKVTKNQIKQKQQNKNKENRQAPKENIQTLKQTQVVKKDQIKQKIQIKKQTQAIEGNVQVIPVDKNKNKQSTGIKDDTVDLTTKNSQLIIAK